MKENVSNGNTIAPMLFPYQPEQFWQSLRQIISEEVAKVQIEKPTTATFETPGMTYKPFHKIVEICELFHITKPTVYDWVKHGKPKPFKVRSGDQ